MTYQFHIEPRDVLFMRDGRPMAASDAGLGANWPRPDQVWSAFINAFHRRWPEHQPWEHKHNKTEDEKSSCSSFRFGALKTAGVFPYARKSASGKDGTTLFKEGLYLPCPLDISARLSEDKATISLSPMQLQSGYQTDLPAPLTHAFTATTLGKEQPPMWMHANDYTDYLAGKPLQVCNPVLYSDERHTGIAIDPETGSTVDGQLYQAEYLRFHPEIRMAVQAECNIIGEHRKDVDVFNKVAQEENIPFVFGGQQGVALMTQQREPLALPQNQLDGDSLYLRWTLLSPAIFPAIAPNQHKNVKAHNGGWLPNWIEAETGRVCLPRNIPERNPGESRDAWRERIAQTGQFKATLIAARIGKPQSFSGWNLQTAGPKPTRIAVPAGSSYVFKCNDEEELQTLANALSWNGGKGETILNRRSTQSGEKGFGLGVCSRISQ